MSDETGFLGGPTVFIQSPDGIWGEFELPEGVRIENGDGFNLFDCRFCGVFYTELVHPPRPNASATPEEREAYKAACAEWRRKMEHDDTRLSFCSGQFVTLIPLENKNA